MLVLQVGARRLGLDTTCAGTLVGRDEGYVVQNNRALQRNGGVEAILKQKTELVALRFPYRVDDDRAVRRDEGGVVFGVNSVGESGSGHSRKVRGVDGELVGRNGVTRNKEAIGSDRLKAGKVVETDYLVIYSYC